MKHLKYFESITKDDELDVKDLFQEIADKYFLVYRSSANKFHDDGGFYITTIRKDITVPDSYNSVKLIITNPVNRLTNDSINKSDIEIFRNELLGFKSRLCQLGYRVRNNFTSHSDCREYENGYQLPSQVIHDMYMKPPKNIMFEIY